MDVALPRIDHVMYGVTDLDAASAQLAADLGLPVAEGAVHADGTRTRTIDCKDGTNVELLVVETPTSPEASWIRDQILTGRRFLGWGVLVDDLEAVSVRLAAPVVPGSVELPDGTGPGIEAVGLARSGDEVVLR